jgi:(2R)-sulfolactate sulfo-lyase subunit beta
MPVIKLSANPLTCETMSEHIDLNVSAILKGELPLDEAGDQLIDIVRRTCNGRFTVTKALGHREFVLAKLYISA